MKTVDVVVERLTALGSISVRNNDTAEIPSVGATYYV